MATPTLTQHSLAGALGPILVDVRSSSRGTPTTLSPHARAPI